MTLVIRFLEEHTGEDAFTLESRILNAARLRNCGTFCHKPGAPPWHLDSGSVLSAVTVRLHCFCS